MSSHPHVLDAPLPARWSRRQRLKNTLIFYVARVAIFLFQGLPLRLALAGATVIGRLANATVASERRRANRHLELALPEMTAAERRRTIREMFVHLAKLAVEIVQLPKLLAGHRAIRLGAAERAVLEEALAEGRGVIAVTGHIGNWELLAQAVATAGYPITTVAGPLYDPRFTRLVHSERTRGGLRIIWRGGGSGGAKEMLRVFKTGGILAMLIDQDTKVQGAFVPFFGRQAHTPTAAAALALRTGAAVVVGWSHRFGNEHRFHLERLYPAPRTEDRDADVVALTAGMTQRLEHAIRQRPAQWVWFHRRWKKQPPPAR